MLETSLFGCIVFPFIAALVLYVLPSSGARKLLPIAIGLIALSALGVLASGGGIIIPQSFFGFKISSIIGFLDFILLFTILYIAWQHKHMLALSLVAAQLLGLVIFDFALLPKEQVHESVLMVDTLAVIMVCVISLVGGIICFYALGYMKEHEHHLMLKVSKQPKFLAIIVLFLGAMNGLVLADNLSWVFFFWEITTLCSFLLISHDGTKEAIENAMRALWMNMVGGVAFMLAIMMIQSNIGTLSIYMLMQASSSVAAKSVVFLLPMALLALAAFTKSALMPFQSWLCGAMVAPTPVSALLHSSTMVKAGVYLLVRLSPMFADTSLGIGIAIFGAFTFIMTSALAVGQSNAKKVLAYSTIANLGLITACAGIGTPAALTAAVLCIIFHAISKGLLFLCVGSIEQRIHSRDIEDMRNLYQTMPNTAIITIIGIMTMMLPPFGMLLAKWMALESAATASGGTILLVLFLAMGSALTVLFWARWAGVMVGYNTLGPRPVGEVQDTSIFMSLYVLLAAAIALSLCSPFLYAGVLQSFRGLSCFVNVPGMNSDTFASSWGMYTVYPLFAILGAGWWLARNAARKAAKSGMAMPYLSGLENVEDGAPVWLGPMNVNEKPTASNYYLDEIFGEARLVPIANIIALTMLALIIGGMLS